MHRCSTAPPSSDSEPRSLLSLAMPAVLTMAARVGASAPATRAGAIVATAALQGTASLEPQHTTGRAGIARVAPPARQSLAVPSAALGLLGLLWFVGVAVGLVRLVGGWIAAGRLGTRAALVDEGLVRDTFDRVRRQTHAGDARLAVSMDVEAPVAIGVTSPTVVVPGHLLDHLPPQSLAPILAHELSHVARRDYAVNLAQSVAEVLLFHSPATWWIGRRIREAREFCCDDSAVAVAGDRARYIEALTLVARLGALTGARPVLGMAGPRLITRVRRLLEGEPIVTMPYARTAVIATLGALLAAALPHPFHAASAQLSTTLFAAGAQDVRPVPIGFPQRQEGSALRIHRVESTDAHVCGTFDVQNVSSVAVAQVRFVGVLSFSPGANRPVQIVESAPIDTCDRARGDGLDRRVRSSMSPWRFARRRASTCRCSARCGRSCTTTVTPGDRPRPTPRPPTARGRDGLPASDACSRARGRTHVGARGGSRDPLPGRGGRRVLARCAGGDSRRTRERRALHARGTVGRSRSSHRRRRSSASAQPLHDEVAA